MAGAFRSGGGGPGGQRARRPGGRRPGAGVRRRDRAHRPPLKRPRRSGTRDRAVPGDGGQLRAQAGGGNIGVTVGDFATATAGGRFTLVYLLRNTITNLTTQDKQIRAFGNAAAHLDPGGCFLIENYIPELRRLPPGETRHVFTATADHIGVEEYDVAAQLAVSRHYWTIEGQLHTFSSTHRYVWPAELDLMARIAGLRLRHRWADWHRTPFTGESRSHVSIWEKPRHA